MSDLRSRRLVAVAFDRRRFLPNTEACRAEEEVSLCLFRRNYAR